MEENLKKIEAVLFAVGKEITSERIASLCSMEVPQVEAVMQILSSQYAQINNSLQIVKGKRLEINRARPVCSFSKQSRL